MSKNVKRRNSIDSSKVLIHPTFKGRQAQEEENTKGVKEFYNYLCKEKIKIYIGRYEGIPTSTQNSYEEEASLVLRPLFLGPGTQELSSSEYRPK